VFGAVALVHGPRGARETPIEDFFLGPGSTALAPGEVLVGITLPPPTHRSGSAYERYTPRQEMDIAVVGVAAQVTLDVDGRVEKLHIALGAVGPTPFRAKLAESRGIGHVPDDATIGAVAGLASREARPISDQRGSATYRRRLVEVLTRRTVLAAVAQAREA
jgi:carbon-monoxide dehydrogenase medium subunit